jgi:porin
MAFDKSHDAGRSDRILRRSSWFGCGTRSLFLALLIVAAVDSRTWAQQPANPPSERPAVLISTRSQDSAVPEASRFFDAGAKAEAEAEDPAAPAFGGPILERPKLTGDWWGWRSALGNSGVTLDVSSTQFYQGVVSGGREQAFQYGGRNDYFMNLDGAELCLWEGFSVFLHGETRYGESVNTIAGTLLAPNLMMAFPLPTGSITALSGVTFTQKLSEDLEVYTGKINTQDGFEQPLTGANNLSGFQNTAMLYNPVYARTVPYSTLGAGFDYVLESESVLSGCVYDTNDTPLVTGFETFFNNGATLCAGLSHPTTFFDLPGNQGLGGTYSTGTYTNLSPSAYLDPIEGLVIVSTPITGSWCLAYNFDQALHVSPDDPERMWGVFGNFGIADSNPSPIRWFGSLGISGASQIAGRESDAFGVAYFYLGVSEPLKDLAPVLLPLRDEHGVEVYYNVAVTPWCHITPDLQVITPFRERLDTAVIVGLRGHIDF